MKITSRTKLSTRIVSAAFAFVIALGTVTAAGPFLFTKTAEALPLGETQLRATTALPTVIAHGQTTCFSVKEVAGLGGNAWTDVNTSVYGATITASVTSGQISTPASAVVTIPAANKTVQGTFCYTGTAVGSHVITLTANVRTLLFGTLKDTMTVPVTVSAVAVPQNLRLNGNQACGYYTNVNWITPTWSAVPEAVSYNYKVALPGGSTYGPVNVGNVTSVSGPFGGEGLSTFSVQAVNTYGQLSEWATPCAVTYDVTKPTSINNLPDYVNGSVAVTQTISDNIGVKSGKLRIWKLKSDGTQDDSKFFSIGDVTADGLGKVVYNFSTANLYGDGKYVAKFTSTDKASNASVDQKEFVVDTSGPTITVQSSAQGDATRNIFKEVGFNFYDANKVANVELNGQKIGLSVATYTNVNTIVQHSNWYNTKEGENTLVADDLAGNRTTFKFTVDTIAPTATVTYSNNNGEWLTKSDVIATLNVNEDVKDIAGWTRVGATNTFTKTFSANGKFTVSVVDYAGNVLSKSGEVKRIDRNAPVITGVADGALVNKPVVLSIFDPKYEGYDGFDQNTGLTVNGLAVATTLGANKTYLKTISQGGTYVVVATDKAGNSTTITFTIDTVLPDMPEHVFPASNAVIDTNDFWFDWKDATDAVKYELQNSQNPAVGSDGAFQYVQWTGDYQGVQPTDSRAHSVGASGTWYWQVRSVDAAGNKSAWTAPWKVTIDMKAPEVTLNGYTSNGNVITPNLVATDDTGLTYAWSGDNADVAVSATDVLAPTFTVSKDGTYSYTLTVTDAAGNATEKTFTFTYAAPVVITNTTNTVSNVVTLNNPAINTVNAGNFSAVNLNDAPADNAANDSDVLGESTDNKNDDKDQKVLAATTTPEIKDGDAKVFGLTWYWWIPIVAGIGGAAWWLLAAYRRRGDA